MDIPVDTQRLRDLILFAGLSTEEFSRIQPCLSPHIFKAGEPILIADQSGEAAFITAGGTVKVHLQRPNTSNFIISILGPGEVLGEISLLDGLGHSASVTALEDTFALGIKKSAFQECLQQMPLLTFNIAAILARRLRLATTRVEIMATLDVYGRVAHQILAFAHEYGQAVSHNEIYIPLCLKQNELAELVGASRARVNQALGFYRKSGYISIDVRYHITVLNMAALAKRCR
jgi:CRP-like cAMP-binding protein